MTPYWMHLLGEHFFRMLKRLHVLIANTFPAGFCWQNSSANQQNSCIMLNKGQKYQTYAQLLLSMLVNKNHVHLTCVILRYLSHSSCQASPSGQIMTNKDSFVP